ncbi:MAG: sulfate respiration complex protein HmcD [Thermodesulfobacteriota bacterium]
MDHTFFTLQDFMTFTKGVTYILMVVSLIGITAFWLFLSERDEDGTVDSPSPEHPGSTH